MQGKNFFYAHAVRNFVDVKGGAGFSAVLSREHDAFKILHALFPFAFGVLLFDFLVDAHGHAGLNIGDSALSFSFNFFFNLCFYFVRHKFLKLFQNLNCSPQCQLWQAGNTLKQFKIIID